MIINGKQLANEITDDLAKQFKLFGRVVMAAIMVGDNPASISFLKQKQKLANAIGVEFIIHKLPLGISQAELIKEIKRLANKKEISAIIAQLPLPKEIDECAVLENIPKEKDVDALQAMAIVPSPAIGAVKFIFEKYKVDLRNAIVVINGFGKLVGRPIYKWLKIKNPDLFISLIRRNTEQAERIELIKQADILISGVGKANLINGQIIKKNAVVIDFGFDFKQGRIYGDISKEAAHRARLFTPTPGGVGPILTAMIFNNLLDLIRANKK